MLPVFESPRARVHPVAVVAAQSAVSSRAALTESVSGNAVSLTNGPSLLPPSSARETLTLSLEPRSSVVGTYVDDVAPVMSVSSPTGYTRTH